MKKKWFVAKTAVMAIAAVVLAACNLNNEKKVENNKDVTEANDTVNVFMNGICGGGTSMNMLEFVSDGDTMDLSLDYVHEHQLLLGGLQENDSLSVCALVCDTIITVDRVVNVTALCGTWTYSDSEVKQYTLDLKRNGFVSTSRNMLNDYQTWMVSKGRLALTQAGSQNNEQAKTEYFDILQLDDDSLVLKRQQPEKILRFARGLKD